MGSEARREQLGKEEAQGQLAPVGILASPGPLGLLDQGRMESRDSEDRLDYLGLLGPRGTEACLESLALRAAVATRASDSLALLAPLDPQETKDRWDLEAYLDSPAPRDQRVRMASQGIQERGGPPENQAPHRRCLQRTSTSWLRTCAVTALQAPQASRVCRVLKGTKVSQDGQGETAQKGKREMLGPEAPQGPQE